MRRILFPTVIAALLSTTAMAADAPDAKPAAPMTPPPLASNVLTDDFTGDYTIDPDHASVIFTISHLGYSHYTGRFNKIDASLHFDAKDPSLSTLKATVTPASVDTHNSTLEAELVGKEWFNTAAFPEATFTATKIEKTGATTGKVTGDFTLMGVTKPITLDVLFNGGGKDPFHKKGKLGFSAKTSIKRSDFGFNTYIPAVGDAVAIDIEAEFFKKDAQ